MSSSTRARCTCRSSSRATRSASSASSRAYASRWSSSSAACRRNKRSCISQNLPCAPAASATSAADSACGCASITGKCRNTKRTRCPKSCNTVFSSGNARPQNGHSKSAYWTSVMRASRDPSTWSPGPTSAASRTGRRAGTSSALAWLDEGAVLQLGVRAPQLVRRVHHDGAVPRYRLLDRLSRHEQESDAGVASLLRHRVPAVEQHQRAVLHLPIASASLGRNRSHLLGADGAGLRGVAERAAALEHVGKRVPRGLDRERLALARWDPHVEIARVRRHPFDRTGLPPKAAADHANARAVVVGHLGDVAARDVLVARPGHLQGRRQVRPELEAVHASLRVALGHLLMEDPAAGGHPLHVTGSQGALVTEAVTVVHRPREDIGDGFDPAMGVPGEPREVILGVLVTKVVEQQKGIEFFGVPKAERAAQAHTGALDGRL